uniref:Uncharacterized protein n=1 Tax=Vespula pensylvanica TaxID=30213 RepID=A0A834KUQ9_VESPE|nr:hypothetical protein H0235_013152 [Vespula pensylvanica]
MVAKQTRHPGQTVCSLAVSSTATKRLPRQEDEKKTRKGDVGIKAAKPQTSRNLQQRSIASAPFGTAPSASAGP